MQKYQGLKKLELAGFNARQWTPKQQMVAIAISVLTLMIIALSCSGSSARDSRRTNSNPPQDGALSSLQERIDGLKLPARQTRHAPAPRSAKTQTPATPAVSPAPLPVDPEQARLQAVLRWRQNQWDKASHSSPQSYQSSESSRQAYSTSRYDNQQPSYSTRPRQYYPQTWPNSR